MISLIESESLWLNHLYMTKSISWGQSLLSTISYSNRYLFQPVLFGLGMFGYNSDYFPRSQALQHLSKLQTSNSTLSSGWYMLLSLSVQSVTGKSTRALTGQKPWQRISHQHRPTACVCNQWQGALVCLPGLLRHPFLVWGVGELMFLENFMTEMKRGHPPHTHITDYFKGQHFLRALRCSEAGANPGPTCELRPALRERF